MTDEEPVEVGFPEHQYDGITATVSLTSAVWLAAYTATYARTVGDIVFGVTSVLFFALVGGLKVWQWYSDWAQAAREKVPVDTSVGDKIPEDDT